MTGTSSRFSGEPTRGTDTYGIEIAGGVVFDLVCHSDDRNRQA